MNFIVSRRCVGKRSSSPTQSSSCLHCCERWTSLSDMVTVWSGLAGVTLAQNSYLASASSSGWTSCDSVHSSPIASLQARSLESPFSHTSSPVSCAWESFESWCARSPWSYLVRPGGHSLLSFLADKTYWSYYPSSGWTQGWPVYTKVIETINKCQIKKLYAYLWSWVTRLVFLKIEEPWTLFMAIVLRSKISWSTRRGSP